MPEDVQIDFCTLGMFIIDEIEYQPPRPPVKNIIGGAGSYSALGARVLSPGPQSRSVGWIVDCGSDFPIQLRQIIAEWDTSCLLRETPDRLTTRGWNGYGDNDHRAFHYLTAKLRLDQDALTPNLLRSKSFHFICSPRRCISMVNGILDRRKREFGEKLEAPLFVWEPVPDLCTPEELENCREALKMVDYVSPNHEEMAGFYGALGNCGNYLDRALIEKRAVDWLHNHKEDGKLKAVVVRAGKDGCLVARRESMTTRWIPAYHKNSDKVIDPTGGGNAFLGGLAIGLVRGTTVEEAAILGSVAASFIIEQVGVPKLTADMNGERWNGERVQDRLERFMQRL